MSDLVVEPKVGIGSIRIGMSLDEVRSAVGEPTGRFRKTSDSPRLTDVYDGLGIHVYYDDSDSVEFIESFPVDGIRHVLYGMPVFELTAEQIAANLSAKGLSGTAEDGSWFVYSSLGLSLWRSHESREHFEAVAVAEV